MSDGKELGRADAVAAKLVFLHLLEGHSDRRRQLMLRDADRTPPGADHLPNVDVDRVRALRRRFGHEQAPLSSEREH